MGLDVSRALKLSIGLLVAALLLKGSLFAALLSAAATAPAAYVMWMGTQEEQSRTYLYGLSLLLGSLLLTLILFILWLL